MDSEMKVVRIRNGNEERDYEEWKRWEEFQIKYAEEENAKMNTKYPIFFENPTIQIDPVENPLHEVNEITFQGKASIEMIFYTDDTVSISCSEPINLKRVFFNRINTNLMPAIKVMEHKRDSDGNIVMRMEDSHFELAGDPRWLTTLPSGTKEEDAQQLMSPHVNAYREERYGREALMSREWKIRGSHIRFINKKNEGNLTIYNRSLHIRNIVTNSGQISIIPYWKYDLNSNHCQYCGK